MTESPTTRMLLSHNFALQPERLSLLSTSEFAEVFIAGLSNYTQISCRPLEHPHWLVEIVFPTSDFSPPAIGSLCAEALINKRLSEVSDSAALPQVLILGGLKTTPATNDNPTALQIDQWGVDVVETESAQSFLESIGWDSLIAGKKPAEVFKLVFIEGST